MTLYFKLLLVSILAAILSLTIKKHSPEISLLIMIASVFASISVTLSLISHIKTEVLESSFFNAVNRETFYPMLKCLGISFLTQISCGICKDAGQSAVAYGLEVTGGIVMILCVIPLLDSLFQIIGGIL